jgi:hypothetical protein
VEVVVEALVELLGAVQVRGAVLVMLSNSGLL